MNYEVFIEDVEGNYYSDGADLPVIEASTPWVAFQAAVDWTKQNNVMPQVIHVTALGSPSCDTENKE